MRAPSPRLALLCLLLAPALAACTGDEEQGSCTTDDANYPGGEFFPGVGRVVYEGEESRNPLAFRYYNASEEICVKGHGCRAMRDWIRFSVAFWHTFRGDGSDPFGSPTKRWPWDAVEGGEMAKAEARMRANFEFLDKIGCDYWCFHDRDIAPEGRTLEETNANLDRIVSLAKSLNSEHGKKVLWGTAQLFKHPRYMHGAATSPDARVFAFAGAQVKKAMDATLALGGENFVFWGGREGYQSLINTDMALELENMARFLKMAGRYKRKIGFQGTLLLEPKPQEPTKHQYDWDVATTSNFLRSHGLESDFKINVECNHATLSGHSCEHELRAASLQGLLGNVDINTGDAQIGWDTDQFLTDPSEATRLMLAVLRQGGLGSGGFNFDAKLRRESTDALDLFYAHVSGMDAVARGLRNAARIINEGLLDDLVARRYESYRDSDLGRRIAGGAIGFEELERAALAAADPEVASGGQEKAEVLFSFYV